MSTKNQIDLNFIQCSLLFPGFVFFVQKHVYYSYTTAQVHCQLSQLTSPLHTYLSHNSCKIVFLTTTVIAFKLLQIPALFFLWRGRGRGKSTVYHLSSVSLVEQDVKTFVIFRQIYVRVFDHLLIHTAPFLWNLFLTDDIKPNFII